ncbi:hypothetical protein TNCV_1987661 [Trichonephila clavipes]|nr:hypothetical protein TNCV_1987661 [Trichonephila clavipes]
MKQSDIPSAAPKRSQLGAMKLLFPDPERVNEPTCLDLGHSGTRSRGKKASPGCCGNGSLPNNPKVDGGNES